MELSINIRNSANIFGLDRSAQMAHHAGFTASDYFIALDEGGSPLHDSNYREIASDIGRRLKDAGIPCRQTHAPFRFPAKKWDEEGHFDVFIKALEISAILGAKTCVVHPLHHMEYLGHEEELFKLNMDYYRRLIPYCKEYGVKVGIENMWQRHKIRKTITFDVCSTIDEYIRYIDTLDSEYMVACLDVGHVVLPDNKDTPADFIRALGHDRLKALHIHDNDYTADQHLLPYHGKLNWDDITKALGEIDYDGDFTYEVLERELTLPDELADATIDYLGAIGKHLVKKVEESRPHIIV